ncbi:unnamed protein product [Cyprideis torosa]|uniref:Uncharacterized protein n=1 Tax=Cyprideis torosa TaxID=163714 RepID=A0A7R8WHN3_9CRUS|nr:unnamed protein product [Cyprideis torosa]CAG0899675.1 unnamed protein product [Cyprideis torosa]
MAERRKTLHSKMKRTVSSIRRNSVVEKTKGIILVKSPKDEEKGVELTYTDAKVIGNGSFGVVYQAMLVGSNEIVAVKKVLVDQRFKSRELQIMKTLRHPNIVDLKYFFFSDGDSKQDVYMNLVLGFMPDTVYKVAKCHLKSKQPIPIFLTKLWMYQLFQGLAYIHSLGVCHRDIKPQNLLLNTETGVLKLCDFGSAKYLVKSEPNVAYICSRYYRAPELILGATDYSLHIDVWSAGCVVAELLLGGQPLFPGESGIDQMVVIIKILGPPTRAQILEMNKDFSGFKFPQISHHPWQKQMLESLTNFKRTVSPTRLKRNLKRAFKKTTPADAIDLLSKLLEYNPTERLSPESVCHHPFFDDLRNPEASLPDGNQLPPLVGITAVKETTL